MSFELARAQLVTIIEGTTPSMAHDAAPAAFSYFAQGSREVLPDGARGVFFEWGGGQVIDPLGSVENWLTRADGSVVVVYPNAVEGAELDALIMSDMRDLVQRLGRPSLMGRPASTLVGLIGSVPFPFTIERVEGAVLLSIGIAMVFSS